MDNRIRLWEVGAWTEIGELLGHEESANSAAMTADEATLVSTGTDRTVRFWDVAGRSCRHVGQGQKNSIPMVRLTVDGGRAVSGDYDGRIVVWDVGAGEPLANRRLFKRHVLGLALHADGETVLASSLAGGLLRLRLEDLEEIGPFVPGKGPYHGLRTTPDGGLMGLTFDGAAHFWDGDGAPVRRLDLGAGDRFSAALSPDGATLAVSEPQRVRLVSASDGADLRELPVGIKGVYGGAWSPDGGLLAVAAADGKARVWEVA